MCLELKHSGITPRIAERDIVVYKYLNVSIKSNLVMDNIKSGDSFSGIIKGIPCNGKIYISEFLEFYFLTDDKRLNGSTSPLRLGYKFSWIMDDKVEEIYVNGNKIPLIKTYTYKTPFQNMEVEIGKTYTSELRKVGGTIREGLHSFKSPIYAKENSGISSRLVVKCIIPKGSSYYTGLYMRHISYASDKLTYVEIVNEQDLLMD